MTPASSNPPITSTRPSSATTAHSCWGAGRSAPTDQPGSGDLRSGSAHAASDARSTTVAYPASHSQRPGREPFEPVEVRPLARDRHHRLVAAALARPGDAERVAGHEPLRQQRPRNGRGPAPAPAHDLRREPDRMEPVHPPADAVEPQHEVVPVGPELDLGVALAL